MSEAGFIAEVEELLGQLDLPELLLIPEPESNLTREQTHQDSSRQKTRRAEGDPAAKLELQRAKDRKRRARYRAQRKTERASLLQQAVELTAELAKLQKPSLSTSVSAWKLLAQRQLQARLDAEAQQRKLNAEVDARATLIHDVCFRLSGASDCTTGGALLQHKRTRVEPATADFFEALLHDLDEIYARTDEVLSTQIFDARDEGWSESWSETGNFVCTHQKVMPVNFPLSCQALWAASQLAYQQIDRQQYDKVTDRENTAAFKFRTATRFGTDTALSVTCVTRRYDLAGRLVVVWRSLLEGEGGFAGLHADETGWAELTPVKDALGNVGNATLMRTYIDHVPMHLSSVAVHEPAVKQFTSAVLDAVFEDGDEILKQLDNLRLTDA